MEPITNSEAPNKTIVILRRLAAEKRETQREMREAFKTDPEVQKAIARLDSRNHESKSV
jgi:hypothetical protein